METGKADPAIHDEFKTVPNWVCWKIVTRKGKATKPPVNPNNGKPANCSNPATWSDYETALRYFETHKGKGIAGIGFQIGGTTFTGVDLDHCHNEKTGAIEPWAREIITKLDSYTELSPSETGFHIFVKGKLPDGAFVKGKLPGGDGHEGKIEMYDEGRYFTLTGKHLEGTPAGILERTAQLAAIRAQYLGQDERPKAPEKPAAPVNASDPELLFLMATAKNGMQIQKLFNGNWQGDYGSQSEADLALCCHLAFWTGKDPERIDGLFRQSALFRDKWDERHKSNGDTFGQITIAKAIERTTETYSPATPKDAAGVAPSENSPATGTLTGETGATSTSRSNDKNAPIDPTRYLKTGAQLQEMDISVSWLVEDLIPEASITTVIGPAGYGKSTLCLNIGNAVDRGLTWLGRAIIRKPVYVLDYENPLAVDVERARALDLSGVLFWHTAAEVPPPPY
ncbi:MAG: AAA family ATPase [Syntrophorhabdales bacterium]|jgi:primase-polymerase (primpol)-like protein